ncbi:hypothetical protein P3T37_003350 [Kitasatospora sp. MAA4]|nr:hypothetical protein [Kitasatospora sp. MAA4]
MLLETVPETEVPEASKVWDCPVCRCLDIKADQAWVTDETGTYRNESAATDIRVRRRQHQATGTCTRPRDSW